MGGMSHLCVDERHVVVRRHRHLPRVLAIPSSVHLQEGRQGRARRGVVVLVADGLEHGARVLQVALIRLHDEDFERHPSRSRGDVHGSVLGSAITIPQDHEVRELSDLGVGDNGNLHRCGSSYRQTSIVKFRRKSLSSYHIPPHEGATARPHLWP